MTAVQLVALEPDGSAVPHWDNPKHGKLKLTCSAGFVPARRLQLPGPCDATAPLILGEGFETTASGWWGAGFEARALLGSIANARLDDVPVARPILVLADDDARNTPINRGLNKAIAEWRCEGRTVLKVKPWPLTRGDNSDFNDLLRADGREAVRRRIMAAIEAVPVLELLPVEDARQDVARAIGARRCWSCGNGGATRASATRKKLRSTWRAAALLGLARRRSPFQHAVDSR